MYKLFKISLAGILMKIKSLTKVIINQFKVVSDGNCNYFPKYNPIRIAKSLD